MTPNRTAVALATCLAAASTTLVLLGAPASAEALCTVDQVTEDPSVLPSDLDVSPDGRWAAVVADWDLGANPEGNNELFLLDRTTEERLQLTDEPEGFVGEVAIARDADRIAFTGTIDPTGGNADENTELFTWDPVNGVVQITETASGDAQFPSISADGSRVAFSSTATIAGQNADGDQEVFVHQVGSTTTAITEHTTRISTDPEISGDGSVVVYTSGDDPLGENADGGEEVFRRVLGGAVTQLTSTPNTTSTNQAAVDEDGSHVAFVSTASPAGATNVDGNAEAFLLEVGQPTPVQLTDTLGGTGAGEVSVAADGDRVLFRSNRNLAGDNADLNTEWLVLDIGDAAPVQLTDTVGFAVAEAAIDADGTHPMLVAGMDPLGTNVGSNREVFAFDCAPLDQVFTDVAPSHPFFDEIGWMAAAGISTGFQPGPTYQPSAAVSRAAMSAFMYRLAESPDVTLPGTPTFGDVPASHPFFEEIEWMAAEGITTGTPASPKPLYKPASAVSRAAMSAFMYRLAGEPEFTPPAADDTTFGDVAASHPFYAEIEWMRFEDITTGTAASPKPLYKPASAVSRAAMSAFMFRLADGPGVDLG